MGHTLIAVGSVNGWAKTAADDYVKRLRAPYALNIIEIPTPKRSGNNAQSAMASEAKKIMAHISLKSFVVLLDERGRQPKTEQLAEFIQDKMDQSRDIVFVIGGPDGFDPQLHQRADYKLSLSNMVMAHHLARVVFLEQWYRVYSLATNHPYHRA